MPRTIDTHTHVLDDDTIKILQKEIPRLGLKLSSVDADNSLLFDRDIETKWHRSIAKIGIDVNKLSGDAGHA